MKNLKQGFNRYIVEYKLVTINNPVVCAMDLMKNPNPPAMLGGIGELETMSITIKNLLCYIENGVASQTQA